MDVPVWRRKIRSARIPMSIDPDIYGWWYMLPSYEILLYLICILLCIYFSLVCICLLYCVWTLYLYLLLCCLWHLRVINALLYLFGKNTFFYIYLIEVYTVSFEVFCEDYLFFFKKNIHTYSAARFYCLWCSNITWLIIYHNLRLFVEGGVL
jgi:hypothetical protein